MTEVYDEREELWIDNSPEMRKYRRESRANGRPYWRCWSCGSTEIHCEGHCATGQWEPAFAREHNHQRSRVVWNGPLGRIVRLPHSDRVEAKTFRGFLCRQCNQAQNDRDRRTFLDGVRAMAIDDLPIGIRKLPPAARQATSVSGTGVCL